MDIIIEIQYDMSCRVTIQYVKRHRIYHTNCALLKCEMKRYGVRVYQRTNST